MQVHCAFCDGLLEAAAEDLGQRISCPHCTLDFELTAALIAEEEAAGSVIGSWFSGSLSTIISTAIHTVILVLCALYHYPPQINELMGEEVMLAELPVQQTLTTSTESEQLETESTEAESESENLSELEVEIVSTTDSGGGSGDLSEAIEALTSSGSSGSGGSGLGGLSSGTGSGAVARDGGDGNWGGMLQQLKRNGLDVVFLFDSTGSMGGEINQVKQQIGRIGATLFKLVPNTRLSVCTYRDRSDAYLVQGLPLTTKLEDISNYLKNIGAGGGGDFPEAVHSGLEWSVVKNSFRKRARKVILLFGDAPPHDEFLQTCLQLSRNFNREQKGVVSTVTCRGRTKLPSFVMIAEVGGGESFLTVNEREIMTQLMVLVFGSRYRNKVLEAFRLLAP